MRNKYKKTLNEGTGLSPSRCYCRNNNVAKNDGATTHGIINTSIGFRKIFGLDVYIQIHIHLVHQA